MCPSDYTGTYDASKPVCTALMSTGICQCTGCGQVSVYMTDLDAREKCTVNGDGTAIWEAAKATCDSFASDCSQSEVRKGGETECSGVATNSCIADTCCEAKATCDTFTCPNSFALKINPSTIPCSSLHCSNRDDLNTCCNKPADGIYARAENNEEDCNNAQTCPGCVENGKVKTKCKCTKNADYKDYRSIIADVDDYCNEDGLWTGKRKRSTDFNAAQLGDRVQMKAELIDDTTQTELHSNTLNYFKTRTAADEQEDNLNYGYVEVVSGKGGKTYGCADKCIWNHKNERNYQTNVGRRLRKKLQQANPAEYAKRGTDVCRTESCALCTMCKTEAASKKYGFKPEIHTFLAPDGGEVYDAGCDATCENKVHNLDGRAFTITAPETMVSMNAAQQADNFDNNKSVHSPDSNGFKGKVLTINGRVGDITYAVAGGIYTMTFNMAGVCSKDKFKIVKLGTDNVEYTGSGNLFTVPEAGTDLEYYCEGNDGLRRDDVIGGIIKSHKADNIQKLLTCQDSACSGCTTCEELSGTEAVTANYEPDADCVTTDTNECTKAIDLFVPSSPDKDINGDGSRIAGGCKVWCEKAFYGIGRYWPALRGEVDDLALITDDADAVKTFREDKVCSWRRCSGCLSCQKRALTEDFAEKESLDDLGDTKHQRQKEARLGGCNMRGTDISTNCKEAWLILDNLDDNNGKDTLCSDRQDNGLDCTGCKKCNDFFSQVENGAITVTNVGREREEITNVDKKTGQQAKKSGANRAIPCPNARLCTLPRAYLPRWQRRGCVLDCFENVGCTDPDAENYDADVHTDDGSCQYT